MTFQAIVTSSVGIFLSLALVNDSVRAEGAARIDAFVTPAGEGFFALSLRPRISESKPRPHDIVVVFDTSASQAGAYREKALLALRALLVALGPEDRVQLLAADVNAVSLTHAFVRPTMQEMRDALAALERRVPLGSTDIPVVLRAVLDAYGETGSTNRDRATVYLGDGMSPGDFVTSPVMRALADEFTDARVPIISYAVGPAVNLPLLGAVAKVTGGSLIVDEEQVGGNDAGTKLAKAAHGAVIWTQRLQLPEGLKPVYYRGVPPLRFDRDSVVVGTYTPKSQSADLPLNVTIEGTLGGKPVSLDFTVERPSPSEENSFLAELVNFARRDGGVTLPNVDNKAVDGLRKFVNLQTFALVRLGKQAVATGNVAGAQAMADAVMRRDPTDPGALTIRRAVAHVRPSAKSRMASAVMPSDQPGNRGAAVPEATDGDLLNEVEQQQRVVQGFLRSEVNNALKEANASMSVDPQGTVDRLKLLLDKVEHTADISADLRSQLVDKIEAALRATNHQLLVKNEQDLRQQQIAAEGEARERINRELFLQQQKVEQLMARFDALMDEERYRDAEAIADIAEEIQPGTPGLRGGELTARMAGNIADMYAVLDLRRRGFVDATYQIELSHIPTADEPPILYPDPEVWQLLTERRKKYKAVDLTQHGPNETKILAALDDTTDLDFQEQPLTDVVDYLKQRHDIEIQLDSKALTDAGVGTDSPITRSIKNITLRSALKLLLSELELTYVIKNEVLMITSKTEAENMLSTRVYPVGDLVVPIMTPRFGGRGMF